MSHSENHDFRRLDQSGGSLPGFQLHLAGGACGDDRGDLLFTNRKNYLCHQATDSHALNSPHQLVSTAAATHGEHSLGRCSGSGPEQQAVHFALRNSMVSPGGNDAANLLPVNPLLNGWKADL